MNHKKGMETINSKPTAQQKSYWIISFLFICLLIISLIAFSSYLLVELKLQQEQLGHLKGKMNQLMSGKAASEILTRHDRQRSGEAMGPENGNENRDGHVGHNEGATYITRVSFVSYTQWGIDTCSGQGVPLFDNTRGIVAAFHDLSGHLVFGSDMYCIAAANNLQSTKRVRTGLLLKPAEFDLFGHSSAFDDPNKSGHLSCSQCYVQGTDVKTQIGKGCVTPEWDELYSGYIVTSYSGLGTSESICVDDNALPAPAGLFTKKSPRRMFPVQSGPGAPFTAGTAIRCTVCYRKTSGAIRSRSADVLIGGPRGSQS